MDTLPWNWGTWYPLLVKCLTVLHMQLSLHSSSQVHANRALSNGATLTSNATSEIFI